MADRLPVQFDNGRTEDSSVSSIVDEHTRQPVLNVVERSIPAEDLDAASEKAFAL
ncbi:hypothetical protein ACWGK5_30575 [Rhodococcus qingshengii]